MKCPDFETLITLVERPGDASLAQTARHVAECRSCAATVREILSIVREEARPSATDEAVAQAVGRTFARRERLFGEVEKILSNLKPGEGIRVSPLPHYRLAAAVSAKMPQATGCSIALRYAASCEPQHSDFWQAEIELPLSVEESSLLAVRISNGEERPLTGGRFALGKAMLANGGGLALLSCADFRANLRSNVVWYEFADARKVPGRLCL